MENNTNVSVNRISYKPTNHPNLKKETKIKKKRNRNRNKGRKPKLKDFQTISEESLVHLIELKNKSTKENEDKNSHSSEHERCVKEVKREWTLFVSCY